MVSQMRSLGVDDAALAEFRAAFGGVLLQPGDDGYDQARKLWNGMIDRHPALIARCAGVADVIRSVELARRYDLLASVRGGGHNVAGNSVCDGGLTIDLGPMRGIRVDPNARTARAQAGAIYRDLDRESLAFGLATTGGAVSETGIAGLTLGGGLGWLMGKHGLASDNVLSVDVVTADGQVLTADENQNADLFWGLRGGGGNLGIATSFKYRLHPLGTNVLAGLLIYPRDRAREILEVYRDLTSSAPDELTAYYILLTLPGDVRGAAIAVCYSGELADGERLVQPLQQLGPTILDTVQPVPYQQWQMTFDQGQPWGSLNYWKSHFVGGISDGLIDAVLAADDARTSPFSTLLFEHMHGAVSRLPADATAFGMRAAAFNVSPLATWYDPAENERHIRWARESAAALEPFSMGAYVNYLNDAEGPDRVRAAYGPTYERLAALKRKYDPTNFFRRNQNVDPAS